MESIAYDRSIEALEMLDFEWDIRRRLGRI
jgi:hypothetical protein